MSLADLQDAKEQVRQAIDIADLASDYLALRRQGRNYVALCPWHDDSRPSLQINPERQSFKCWVCDIGGDIFAFLMKMEGMEFREALEALAERAGIDLAPRKLQGPSDSQFDRKNLFAAMSWAEQQFHNCLLKSPVAETARRYLADRGVNEQSIDQFQLGFAPPEWDWLLKRASNTPWSPAVLERIGLVIRRDSGGYYDRFRGRLMFSIRDVRSRPIACGGRVLPEFAREGDAKYINSPETPLFNKSRELYALDLARKAMSDQDTVLVMEGYTDVIMAHQHGISNAVAVLGTALNAQHVPVLRRFTDSITLVLDGDAAGQRRTMDILDQLLALFVNHEIELRILGLPEGSDPCDVISSQGREAFARLLETSRDALTHKMEVVMNALGSTPAAHRATRAVESILATLARALPRGAAASSAALVREEHILSRLAKQFGVAEASLRDRLKALRRSAQAQPSTATRFPTDDIVDSTPTEQRPAPSGWERELIELILAQPESFAELAQAIASEEISCPWTRQVYELAVDLLATDRPVHFETLITTTDDPQIKSLLVDCDEANARRTESDPEQRLRDALAGAKKRRDEARHQSQVATLHQKQLNPEQEEEVLAELFRELKQQQDSLQR